LANSAVKENFKARDGNFWRRLKWLNSDARLLYDGSVFSGRRGAALRPLRTGWIRGL